MQADTRQEQGCVCSSRGRSFVIVVDKGHLPECPLSMRSVLTDWWVRRAFLRNLVRAANSKVSR